MTHDEAVAADIAADRPDVCPLADAVLLHIARQTGLRGEMHGASPTYAKVMLRAYVDAVFAASHELRSAWAAHDAGVSTSPKRETDPSATDGGSK